MSLIDESLHKAAARQQAQTPAPSADLNRWKLPAIVIVVLALLIIGGGAIYNSVRPAAPSAPAGSVPMVTPAAPAATAAPLPTTAPEPTALPAGWVTLPEMPDATFDPWNGQLVSIAPQPARITGARNGAGGRLCETITEQGGSLWVPCWRLNLPDATATPIPPPQPVYQPPAAEQPAPAAAEVCGYGAAMGKVCAPAGSDINELTRLARATEQAVIERNHAQATAQAAQPTTGMDFSGTGNAMQNVVATAKAGE